MIVKVSFLVAASVVACAVSHNINSNSRKKQSTIKVQDGACMETNNIEDEQANYDIPQEEDKEEANVVRTKLWRNVSEKEDLKREFEQRKENIEGNLVELYGLKEEKSRLTKLQKDIDEKSTEIVVLSDTIASLQAEKKKHLLRDDIKQGILAAKKLELAKKTIGELEREIDRNRRHLKGRVSMLREKVCGFQGNDDGFGEREDEIEKKIKGFRDVELEVGMRRRIQKQLELEKRELTVKLLGAQDRIASLSQMTEGKVLLKIEDEITKLKHGNEDLSREIERLQKERFEMVEELVYQRWLNICLRLEKQNKDNPPRDTFNYGNPKNNPPSSCLSSSFSFSSSESDQVDTTTIGSSSSTSSQSTSRKSFSLIKRIITKWGCKDDSFVANSVAKKSVNSKVKTGRVRRFSASTVLDYNKGNDRMTSTSPFDTKSKLENGVPRVRRVSFSDLVKTHYDMPSSFRRRGIDDSCCKSTDDLEGKENSEEKSEISVVNGEDSIELTRLENTDEGDCIKTEIADTSKENKVEEDQMMQHIFNVLFVFLFFILLAYFLYVKTKS